MISLPSETNLGFVNTWLSQKASLKKKVGLKDIINEFLLKHHQFLISYKKFIQKDEMNYLILKQK
jgi:hypothetical protein